MRVRVRSAGVLSRRLVSASGPVRSGGNWTQWTVRSIRRSAPCELLCSTQAWLDSQARRAAFLGVVSIGLSSVISNIVVKPLLARARPQRDAAVVPSDRWVRMPTSSSLPSGHSASAFAFATAVGYELPALSIPLRVVAAAVAYSRVHTGVHYPGDTVAGSVIGASAAQIVTRIVGDRRRESRACPLSTDEVSRRPARPAFRRP
jgi:membrane-associated phospholipid phosphatase